MCLHLCVRPHRPVCMTMSVCVWWGGTVGAGTASVCLCVCRVYMLS